MSPHSPFCQYWILCQPLPQRFSYLCSRQSNIVVKRMNEFRCQKTIDSNLVLSQAEWFRPKLSFLIGTRRTGIYIIGQLIRLNELMSAKHLAPHLVHIKEGFCVIFEGRGSLWFLHFLLHAYVEAGPVRGFKCFLNEWWVDAWMDGWIIFWILGQHYFCWSSNCLHGFPFLE